MRARPARSAGRTTGCSSRSSAPSARSATSSTSPSTRWLVREGLHYNVAAAFSFLVAVTNNYTWNRLWTFRGQRGHVGYQGLRFFIVSLLALAANEVLLTTFVAAGAGKVVAQAIAVVLVTPINFVGNKLWSFRRR